jgi:flagellar basal body-associated protein FliL
VIEMDEEKGTLKRFIIIVVVMVVIILGIYYLTKYTVKKDTTSNTSDNTTEVTVDNSKAIVGTMLNKVASEYYVIIYNSTSSDASSYEQMVTSYKAKTNALPVYTVDLNNALNSKFYSDTTTNPIADNINDLKFGNITVIKVKSSKITNAYETVSAIKKVWKIS